MQCPSCGHDQPAERKFCTNCGTSLASPCPTCGTPAEPGARFCGECGTALDAALAADDGAVADAAPADPTADPGRRRFVTVLFADLVGFTPFSESRDSEDVRAMLTRYFDRSRDVIERFGGVVDKYIGDAVMAVWGAETAREDDAERGVRAGLELVDAVGVLGEELGIDGLTARVGVLSGRTSVGMGGNERGLVVGDLVNTASRLESSAEPGTVVVGRSTYEMTSSAISYQPLGRRRLKGKEEEVEAWRATRVVAQRGGEGRVEGLVPPFVGRDHDLRLLKDLLHATSRERRARLVSVVGQVGIGKSRLVQELANYVDGLTEPVYWHEGRSPAYGDGLTFWALGEMVRRRCGIADTDDDHRTRTRLLTTLAEYVPEDDERSWLEPRLAGLIGLGDVPITDRAELFSAWRTFFERVSRRGTVVMVFEDLHWADPGMLDFVDDLALRSVAHPILIVTLARPDLLEERPGWGSGQVNTLAMQLAPLSAPDMAALVEGMAPGTPSQLVSEIVAKAGGIPLYAVEFVRMLVNRGTLVRRGPGFAVEGDAAGLAVPESLVGVVGARIDQLEPEDRALLEDAAVLGQSFTLEGLTALRPEDPATLRARLADLVANSLLAVNTDPRSPERGQYTFVQSLIREVIHDGLTKTDRRERHLAVADYFASLGEPELAPAVAAHLAAALEATPDGAAAEELARRTVKALRVAAERAASLQSHQQARAFARQALDVNRDEAVTGHLLIRIATSSEALLDENAVEHALAAIDAFGLAGDQEGVLAAATTAMRIYNDSFHSRAALDLFAPIYEDLEPGRSPARAAALAQFGRAHLLASDDMTEGLGIIEEALAIAEPLDLVDVVTDAINTRGTMLSRLGRTREGLALVAAACDLAGEYGLDYAYQRAMNNYSYLLAAESPRRSMELAGERLAATKRVGEIRPILHAVGQLASYYAMGGDWEAFEETLDAVPYDDLVRADQITIDDQRRWRRQVQGEPEWAEQRWRELTTEFRDLVGEMERQIEDWWKVDEAFLALHNGRPVEAFDLVIDLDDDSPNLTDVEVSLVVAMYLEDGERLQQVADVFATKVYRGRRVDWLRLALEGALAAAGGERDAAAGRFREASDLMEGHELELRAAEFRACMAGMLGLDHPLGRELGQRAFAAFSAAGATTLLGLYADSLVDEAEEGAVSASA